MWIKIVLIIGVMSWMLIVIHSTLNLLEKRFEKVIDDKLKAISSKLESQTFFCPVENN